MSLAPYTIRRATPDDAGAIAEVNVDSIRSLGASAYGPEIVEEWGAPRDGRRYVEAMEGRGVTFFVAVQGEADEPGRVLGFSSHGVEDGTHRVAVYVRGEAARKGVGTALLREVEDEARRQGAREIRIDASLGAVGFYRANGFEEVGRGEHVLRGGRPMPCVIMRKTQATS